MGNPIVVTKKAVTETLKEKKVVAKAKQSKEKAPEKKTIKLNTIPAMLILAKEKIEPLLKINVTRDGAVGTGHFPLALKDGEKVDDGHGKKVNQLAVKFEYKFDEDFVTYNINRFDEIKKDEKTVTKIWKRIRSIVRPQVLAIRKAEREKAASEKKIVAKKADKKVVAKKVVKKSKAA